MKGIVIRLSILAVGAMTIVYGLLLMHQGIFVYQNAWFRGTNYSAGTVAAGVFLCLLVFLPPTAWVERWIAPKKKKPQDDHPKYHQRHHGPK
jgi:hypothetical protein